MQYFADHFGWPIAVMSVLMTIGAVIDGWKRKVPNWQSFPTILLGWAWWTAASWQHGDWRLLGLSVAGAFAAGLPLFILWRIGFMGAGDVKLYAGFGAWMVPVPGFGFAHLGWAFGYSVVLGGVMGLAMILWRGKYFINMSNAQAAVNDLMQGGGADAIRAKALERKKTDQLLPYGVPLTIGSLAYVAVLFDQWGRGW